MHSVVLQLREPLKQNTSSLSLSLSLSLQVGSATFCFVMNSLPVQFDCSLLHVHVLAASERYLQTSQHLSVLLLNA